MVTSKGLFYLPLPPDYLQHLMLWLFYFLKFSLFILSGWYVFWISVICFLSVSSSSLNIYTLVFLLILFSSLWLNDTILCQQPFICWWFSNHQAGRQLLLNGNKLRWELCWMLGIQPKETNLIYAFLASLLLFRYTFYSAPPALSQFSSQILCNYNSFLSLPLTVSPNPVYTPMEQPYFLKQEKACKSNLYQISLICILHDMEDFPWNG